MGEGSSGALITEWRGDRGVAWWREVKHRRNVPRRSSPFLTDDVGEDERRKLFHELQGRAWASPQCPASRLSGPEEEEVK